LSYGIIYCAYCTVTGKSYIGQTTQGLNRRWAGHVSDVKRNQLLISKAIAEHGADAFELSVVAETESQEQLDALEKLWIILKRSYDPAFGYNRQFGGLGGKHTEEAKAKNSASNRGRVAHNKGKPMSDDQRMKISVARQPNPSPQALYLRAWRERKRLEAA
jgi:group I intron endonuclease